MLTTINTERLTIEKLQQRDSRFILELLNTEGWKKYIGNKNINSNKEAIEYIQKINEIQSAKYWTVKLKYTLKTIGLVTLIKRNYREHSDIGFAFLPQYNGKGYAFEATKAVITSLILNQEYQQILAETVPENSASIKLIKKLGLKFEKEISVDSTVLSVFSATKTEIISHLEKS